MRIALAVDELDWHARALLRGFAAEGAECVPLVLACCAFDTGVPHGLVLPGFGNALPDAVLVRAISAGSFEEVTRRLGILHALRERGVRVWNDARAIERCVDKSMTSFFLARAGLPTPPTWTVEGIAAAQAIVAQQVAEAPLVLKPLFGAQGRGLRLIGHQGDLPPEEDVAGVYYLQRYVSSGLGAFRDHRLFVCDGRVVAAMTRHSPDWITNVKRGGTPEALCPDAELSDLAVQAAASVGAGYAGVDIIRDAAGKAWVLEVNSMPGWKGLQRVVDFPIAHRLVAALLAAMR